MSCYGWMVGSLKMQAKQVNALQTQLNAMMNKKRSLAIANVNAAVTQVLADFKGKRNVDWLNELEKRVEGSYSCNRGGAYEALLELDFPLLRLFPNGVTSRPVLAKEKDFAVYNAKTTRYPLGRVGMLTLSKSGGVVDINVPENNHAIENAKNTDVFDVALEFFNQLDWPRGGGGAICSNDEYSRESRAIAGGANRVEYHFQYKSPRQKAEEAKAKAANRNRYALGVRYPPR